MTEPAEAASLLLRSERSAASACRNEPQDRQAHERWLQWVFSHVDKTESPQLPTKGLHKDDH